MPYLKYINDEGLNIARGLVRHTTHVNKFGYSEAIGASYETVWAAGTLMAHPSNANTVILTSDDAEDGASNNGAHIVSIQGIDENGFANSLSIPMNGVGNASNTDIKFKRVYRMSVEYAGSSRVNEGNISATVGSTTVAYIPAGEGQTLQAAFSTAKNQTGYIIDMMINTAKAQKAGLFRLVIKDTTNGDVQKTQQVLETFQNTIRVDYPVPIIVPPEHDIEIQGQNISDSSVMSAAATFNIILVEDPDV